jgi:hypothetical protein
VIRRAAATVSKTPWEILGLRAGVKGVAFLKTADPSRIEPHLAGFSIARRHHAGLVELFASRDPALAERALSLQAGDPTRNAPAIGALLGYPECCIEAFAAQPDRSSDPANRFATAARTSAPQPWPWETANFDRMIAAFFPCRYDCAAARAHARAILAEADREEPGLAATIERELRAKWIYAGDGRWAAIRDASARIAPDASAGWESTVAGALSGGAAPAGAIVVLTG